MRHKRLATVAATAIALLGATSASGQAAAPIPTQVLVGLSGGTNAPNSFVISVTGPLMSPVAKCRAGRTVKLFFRTGGARRLVDVDVSSSHGQWGVLGRSSTAPQAYIVAVTRAHVKVHGRPRTCGADRVVTPVNVVQPRV